MRRIVLVAAIVAAAVSVVPSALAADVLSPTDGELVGSRPTFVFDILNGVADIELSRSPETLTAGLEAGQFVDPAATSFAILYNREPRDGVALWNGSRLSRGLYYWHVQLRDDAPEESVQYPWGPVRTLTVKDEPVVLEGWLARLQRLRSTRACPTRLRAHGTIKWSDNEVYNEASARYSVTLKAGSRIVGRVRGDFSWVSSSFDGSVCVKRRLTGSTLTATATLRDPGNHIVTSEPRRVRIAG